MKEPNQLTHEEGWAALEQDPKTGVLFLNLPIPAVGQRLDIDPNEPTDNWESIVAGDEEC